MAVSGAARGGAGRALGAGLAGGACGGALAGLLEGAWCAALRGLEDGGLLWWGPLAYGVALAPVGAALALLLRLLPARAGGRAEQARRRPFAPALGGTLALAFALFGRWRFYADFRQGVEDTPAEKALIALGALLVAAAVGSLAALLARRLPARLVVAASALPPALAFLAGLVAAGPEPAERGPGASAAPRAPDVLLIVADTLRADVLSLYDPSGRARTPHLDAFARDAVLFEGACAQASWTKPSFGTLLTGTPPRTHTADSHYAVLPEAAVTLAEAFRDGGYFTTAIANANPNFSRRTGFDQGFHAFDELAPSHFAFGAPRSATDLTLYRRLRAQLGHATLDVRNYYQPAEVVVDRFLARAAARRAAERAPLFAVVHFMDPHDPYMGGRTEGPGFGRHRTTAAEARARREDMVESYVGDVERMDEALGRLLSSLRRLGLYEDAVIAFTSDHGEEFHDHGGWWHGNTLYEELIHVPLLVKLPGEARAPRRDPRLVRHLDLPPTLLALAGREIPRAMQGRPLFGEDAARDARSEAVCLSETRVRGNELVSLRAGSMKLIRAHATPQARLEPVELYDLAADPGERRNRAGEGHPSEARLRERLAESVARAERAALEGAEPAPATPELRRQLEALGYLGED